MQKAEKMQELRVFAQEIRVETLKTVGSLGFGHVPGAMSVIDALAVLYGEVMKVDPKNPQCAKSHEAACRSCERE